MISWRPCSPWLGSRPAPARAREARPDTVDSAYGGMESGCPRGRHVDVDTSKPGFQTVAKLLPYFKPTAFLISVAVASMLYFAWLPRWSWYVRAPVVFVASIIVDKVALWLLLALTSAAAATYDSRRS